jgi:two-component system sensor histidine kinase/response regulator
MPIQPTVQPNRVLAVDDSDDNLFLIEAILDGEEYDLSCAKSGEEALGQIAKAPPDIILLDIMMPGMNGYEVTQKIRQDTSLPYIPILLITAHDNTSLVEGLDAGADDFIRKPVDIEELRARVRSLIRLKQTIDAQTHMLRQRDDFVARLTHDLRTPLVAANRMLKLCIEEAFGAVANDAKTAMGDTIKNNQQLLDMVNTLLEVYRHEAGYKTIARTPLNLYEMVATVVEELRPLANEKSLEFKLTDASGQRITNPDAYEIQGDAMELRRVITNLIGNAIKFTDQGMVHVQLEQQAKGPTPTGEFQLTKPVKHWIVLTVVDTGVGISEEDQGEIFKWFRQGKQRRSGSGLGLHLACRIIGMHGGSIEVESEVDQGSTFRMYLPVFEEAKVPATNVPVDG